MFIIYVSIKLEYSHSSHMEQKHGPITKVNERHLLTSERNLGKFMVQCVKWMCEGYILLLQLV